MTQRTELLSVKETSQWLRLSPSTLFRLVRRGKIRPVKLGRRTFFAADEIQTFIETSRTAVAHEPVQPRTEREQVLATLRDAGLLADPTPEMKAQAAAWDALSVAEKQEVLDVLEHLDLDVSLSEIIRHNRN